MPRRVARPADVIAGFDADATAIASARRSAARRRVADRVTLEVAAPGRLLGDGYDPVFLLHSRLDGGDQADTSSDDLLSSLL